MTGIEAGKAYVKFILDDKELKAKLTKVGEKLKSIGKIGAAASAPLVAGFTAATAAFTSAGDELAKASQRIGFSVESLSELKYAADQSGTSLAGIERAAKRMQVGILDAAKGTGPMHESLQMLGIDLAQLQAQSPEQQFLTLSRAISGVEDPTLKAALAQKVFGKAGTELLPMLAEGQAGIDALRQRANELGLTMSTETANAAVTLGDNIDDLKQQVYAMAVNIGAAVAGPLTGFAQALQPIFGWMINIIKACPQLVKLIGAITVAIGTAAAATYGMGIAINFATAHPIITALSVIAAAAATIASYFWDSSEAVGKLGQNIDALPGGGGAQAPDVRQIQQQAAAMAAQANAGMQTMPVNMQPMVDTSQLRNDGLQRESNNFLDRIANATERTLLFLQNNRGRGYGLMVGAE